MDHERAVKILKRHLVQCAALMPIDWIRQSGEDSEFQQAMRLAISLLEGKEGPV